MTKVDGHLFNALVALRSALAAATVAGDANSERAIDAMIADVLRLQSFLKPHIDEVTGD